MQGDRTQSDHLQSDRGAVVAEFTIVLPAILMVLMLAVGAILLATQRVALTSAAAEVARLEARGDSGASARLGALPSGVSVARSRTNGLYCVTLDARPLGGLLGSVGVSARGCAAEIQSSESSESAVRPGAGAGP